MTSGFLAQAGHRLSFDDAYLIIRRIAGAQVSRMVRSWALPEYERDELSQHVAVELWRKFGALDPSRPSPEAYIGRAVANELVSTIRTRLAAKRRICPPRIIPDESNLESRRLDLRIDIARVLWTLPAEQRRVGFMLGELSPTEVSRCLRISRARVYRIIEVLREEFQAAGYKESL